MNIDELIEIAKSAMQRSYAPYSKYYVGAALLCKNGKIYTGCNVENHGIMSICAERVAFTKAISEGEREFECLVLCGGKSIDDLDECLPCGYCRQFMSEFVDSNFIIYIGNQNNKITSYKLEDLLPYSFKI
ncbi:MAG: cytidine deaminase [Clostridia bacterium]|nr:cytidine deaminase [Clostridia bacterium]